MHEEDFGKRDLFHPVISLISEKREEILGEWLKVGQTERVVAATGELPDEIWRDFLSAVISEVWACAWEKFKGVSSGTLAKCFHDLRRSAEKVLESSADPHVLHRVFEEGLVALLNAHAVATENLCKEYRKAVDYSAIVSTADLTGVITFVNDRFCEISGYERDELLGRPHNVVRHPDMEKEVFSELWRTIRQKKVWHGILKNRRKTGESYWVDTTITPVLGVNGEIREYISVRWEIPDPQTFCKNLESL